MKKRWIALIIIFLSAAFSVVSYRLWDIPVAYEFQRLTPAMINIVDGITQAGESLWYYIILVPAFVLMRFIRKDELWSTRILYVLLSLSFSGIISTGIKWLLCRNRPINLFEDGLYGFEFFKIAFTYEVTSFPSGHSVTAFALATALSFLLSRWRWVVFAAAVLIAASRVALTAHYLSDVIAGAAIGVLCAMGVKYWFDRMHFELHESI